MNEKDIQKQYYKITASNYDSLHLGTNGEHEFALAWLSSLIKYFDIKSVLDVGSGTGRALLYLKNLYPDIILKGIEPVEELRKVAYDKGLSRIELIDGDAYNINFETSEYDLVCEFGVLHHVRYPDRVIKEMLRVSRKAIFISDSNNFGQGSLFVRSVKQFLNGLGLWKFADFIKTKGKGYIISEGDGLSYSYSVFNSYRQIKKCCKSIYFLNTAGGNGNNIYRTASHVALLGIKE
jgi:SAM-dependent methyltransferase